MFKAISAFLWQSVLLASLLVVGFGAVAQDVDVATIFEQVSALIAAWGGFEWMAKVAGVLTIVISLTKMSALRSLWDKLGDYKFWVAPVLSLAVGLLTLRSDTTTAGVIAYLTTGLGAVALHEILDLVKKIPGLNSIVSSAIDLIKILLKAPPAPPQGR